MTPVSGGGITNRFRTRAFTGTSGVAYSAVKAATHGVIRDVALELGEHGVHVNTVAPGPIG